MTDSTPLPTDMTASKLRQIADYITESDNIIADLLTKHGISFERAGIDVSNEWSELVTGRAMQEDLRRWADEVDTCDNVTIPRSVVEDAISLARELGGPGYDEHEEWTWPIRDLARYVEEADG